MTEEELGYSDHSLPGGNDDSSLRGLSVEDDDDDNGEHDNNKEYVAQEEKKSSSPDDDNEKNCDSRRRRISSASSSSSPSTQRRQWSNSNRNEMMSAGFTSDDDDDDDVEYDQNENDEEHNPPAAFLPAPAPAPTALNEHAQLPASVTSRELQPASNQVPAQRLPSAVSSSLLPPPPSSRHPADSDASTSTPIITNVTTATPSAVDTASALSTLSLPATALETVSSAATTTESNKRQQASLLSPPMVRIRTAHSQPSHSAATVVAAAETIESSATAPPLVVLQPHQLQRQSTPPSTTTMAAATATTITTTTAPVTTYPSPTTTATTVAPTHSPASLPAGPPTPTMNNTSTSTTTTNMAPAMSGRSPPLRPSVPQLQKPSLRNHHNNHNLTRQTSTGSNSGNQGKGHQRTVSWHLEPSRPDYEVNFTFSNDELDNISQVSPLPPAQPQQQWPLQQPGPTTGPPSPSSSILLQQQGSRSTMISSRVPKSPTSSSNTREHRPTPSLLQGNALSLAELMAASPLEDEAEAYLQSTLDEAIQDPRIIPQVQQHILGGAPDDAFEQPASVDVPPISKPPMIRRSPSAASSSVAASLTTAASPPAPSPMSPSSFAAAALAGQAPAAASPPDLPTLTGSSTANNNLLSRPPSIVSRQTTAPPGLSPSSSNVSQAGGGGVPSTAGTAPAQRPPLPRPPVVRAHARGKSTAEDLFDLTKGFETLQQQAAADGASPGYFSSWISSSSGASDSANDVPTSSAEALAQNASTLLKRHKRNESDKSNEHGAASAANHSIHDEETSSHASVRSSGNRASESWGKLRQAVSVGAALKDAVHSKKTDEPADIVITEENDSDIAAEQSTRFGDSGGDGGSSFQGSKSYRNNKSRRRMTVKNMKRRVQTGFEDFEDWLKLKKIDAYGFIKIVLVATVILSGVAAILFYLAGNPPCGSTNCVTQTHLTLVNGSSTSQTKTDLLDVLVSASASWWLLFVCRQIITFTIAKGLESFIIDFLALRTKLTLHSIGAFGTLFIVQSRGWPISFFLWAVLDLAMLFGNSQFAHHWLYWQGYVDLMNENNSSGTVTDSGVYRTVLILAVVISFVVAVKRFYMGIYLGRRTFFRYADDLASVMKKALLVGETASLARDLAIGRRSLDLSLHGERYLIPPEEEDGDLCQGAADAAETTAGPEPSNFEGEASQAESKRSLLGESATGTKSVPPTVELPRSLNARIDEILGAWEQPELEKTREENASIGEIIQFRQSLSYLNTNYPFSAVFGRTSTRQECVECTEHLYKRLLKLSNSSDLLKFDTLALLAVGKDGSLDEEKLKAVVRLFRPDRQGYLSLVDFAKSVDSCYKEMRLLKASVASSSKMDRAFESMFNVLFYFVVGLITVAALGANPLVIFASLSGFVLGFSFMISSASSKYFEGLLFIFIRRPYDIGDRINVSLVTVDTSPDGSPGWIVKDVDLFTTTVIYGTTNEVATYSNGSLASSRIINAARSPRALLYVYLKFPVDTRFGKFKAFRSAVEKFILARPREWRSFSAFRATLVQVDLGYIQYVLVVEHRESWQNISALLGSKAQLASFALELQKKMNIRYRSPPMPVDLTMNRGGESPFDFPDRPNRHPGRARTATADDASYASLSALFD